jgi:hypothetical protein
MQGRDRGCDRGRYLDCAESRPAATLFAPPIVGFGNHGLLALAIVAVGLTVRGSEDHQRQHGRKQKLRLTAKGDICPDGHAMADQGQGGKGLPGWIFLFE